MMKPSPLKGFRQLALGAVVIGAALVVPAAMAQTPGQSVRPPKIETPGPAKTWLAMLVAVGAGALAIGVAVIPSQRTHQD